MKKVSVKYIKELRKKINIKFQLDNCLLFLTENEIIKKEKQKVGKTLIFIKYICDDTFLVDTRYLSESEIFKIIIFSHFLSLFIVFFFLYSI